MVHKAYNKLSIIHQCRLLKVPRSSFYYTSCGENTFNIGLMAVMDKLFTEYPFYGVRQMCCALRREGYAVGNKRVRRLMRQMGLQTIYQAPKTTKSCPEHKKYPYLLRDVTAQHCNHVWSTDITYIPMRQGFLYLVAIMDWHSRAVLSWRLSNSMDTGFCIEALQEALDRYGKPEIFNSDQGSQFTSIEFTSILQKEGIKISMDGRGRCLDNIFTERLWRSLKYEEVYLHAYESGREARDRIGKWIEFYNYTRPHSALDGTSPMLFYTPSLPQAA